MVRRAMMTTCFLKTPAVRPAMPRESDLPISYQELDNHLTTSELGPSAAEAHGILCALLCSGAPQAVESWIAELLGDTDTDGRSTHECRHSLQGLATHTQAGITGPRLDFMPLLPDDSRPLAERALGLYDWSRGFLYGLGVAGPDIGRLPEPVREACNDFVAITHLDLRDLEASEANEQALMELTEFVRVATLVVYQEQRRAPEAGR